MTWLARVFGAPGTTRDLVAELEQDYRAEAEHAAHLRDHAERARYAQDAATLRELAAQEERHAAALAELIVRLGGGVPPVAPAPLLGRNPWERAVKARDAAHAKRHQILQRINAWDPDRPDVVEVLQRIEREDAAALGRYDAIIMRADPQSLD